MKKIPVFGIFREKSHSPRREYDDEAILRQTARFLSDSPEIDVELFLPEEFLHTNLDVLPALIFFMCEEAPYLERLRQMNLDHGCVLVNTVHAVENTFRDKMVEILSGQPFFPESKLHEISMPASLDDSRQCWLKRGDYHATCDDDVIFVEDKDSLPAAMAKFSARNIKKVLVQEHVPGDIIKFYCIRDSQAGHTWWFKWFYHKEQDLKEYAFSSTMLEDNCIMAGDLMGLDIYGGDAIVTAEGEIFVIDVNAWPSFALFRQEAAGFIAQLLKTKLVEHLGAASQLGTRLENTLSLSV